MAGGGETPESRGAAAARFVLSTLPMLLLGVLMLLAVAINLANVIGRYVFGHALFWAEESMVFIVIWGVFLGMVAFVYRGEFLCMDLFSSRARGWSRTALNIAMTACLLLAAAFVVTQSWKVVSLFINTGAVSVAAEIPKAIPHAAILFGFALVIVAVLVRLRAFLTGRFDSRQ